MTKRLLSNEAQKKIEAAIQEVEKHTDAELIAVLARQSDDYNYIALMYAACFALLSPLLVMALPFWLEAFDIFLIQAAVFFVLALLFRVSTLRFFLIPKSVRYWRAANMARRQFLENNLHHTKGETGVLIFVSELEHYVEIIADRGINNQVEKDAWQHIVNDFIAAIKKGETEQGYLQCVKACGALLIEHVPVTSSKNELPNHLIVLG